MKKFSIVFCLGLMIALCCAWIKKDPVRPERFVGKWFLADWKIDGVTDPDYVHECDSTTYILRADGSFTFCRVWYKRNSDTATVCGNWEYYEKKNQLLFHWTNPKERKPEIWNIQSSDASEIVVVARNHEIHYQKAP